MQGQCYHSFRSDFYPYYVKMCGCSNRKLKFACGNCSRGRKTISNNKTRSLFVHTDNVSVTIPEDNTQKYGKYGNGSTKEYPSQKDEITKGM